MCVVVCRCSLLFAIAGRCLRLVVVACCLYLCVVRCVSLCAVA